jgi:hypothetical protein
MKYKYFMLPVLLTTVSCGSTSSSNFTGLFNGQLTAGSGSSGLTLSNTSGGSSCNIIGSIPAPPGQNATAITNDSSNLWVVQSTIFNKVNISSGAVINSFTTTVSVGNATFDGTNFWAIGNTGLFKVSPAGSILSSFTSSAYTGPIGYLSANLWVGSGSNLAQIIQITPSNTQLTALNLPGQVFSLSSDGKYLWAGFMNSSGTYLIAKIDTVNTSIKSFCQISASSLGLSQLQLTWINNSVWVIQNSASKILQVDVSGM